MHHEPSTNLVPNRERELTYSKQMIFGLFKSIINKKCVSKIYIANDPPPIQVGGGSCLVFGPLVICGVSRFGFVYVIALVEGYYVLFFL